MEQEVSKKFNTDINTLLEAYLDLKRSKQDSPILMGRIVNNNDPQKLGRCKVMVYQKFEGIPESDLPWAIPEFSIAGSDLGAFVVPEIDDLVTIYFKNDEPSNPVYSKKFLNSSKLSSQRDEDYPNTMVLLETIVGEYFKINKKTNESIYRHSSGTIITFEKNGSITIDTTNSSSGNVKMNIFGNITIESSGNIDIQSTGNMTIDSTGTMNVESATVMNVDAANINFPQGSVIPTGNGPLQALKFDLITGIPVAGSNFFKAG